MLGTRFHGRGGWSGLKSPGEVAADSVLCSESQEQTQAGSAWHHPRVSVPDLKTTQHSTASLRAGVVSQLSGLISSRSAPRFSASAFKALVLPSLPALAGGAHCKSSHRNQSRGGLARQAGEAPASGRNKNESTQLHKSLCTGKGGVTCFKKQEIPHENELWCSVTREGHTRTTASAELSNSACLVEWNQGFTTSPMCEGVNTISFATLAFYRHSVKHKEENNDTELVLHGNKNEVKLNLGS